MFSKIELDNLAFGAQQRISAELLENFGIPPKVSAQYDMLTHSVALNIRQEVYAQHLERATYTTWATWRDAVKERVYAWLDWHWPIGAEIGRKRWPVQWRKTTIDVKALYPKIGLPHERHSVMVMPMQDEITTYLFPRESIG